MRTRAGARTRQRRRPATCAGETARREASGTWSSDLNVCCKKGLCERFDSTIGAGTVLMPFGGQYQLTPVQAMAAKLPVTEGETNTAQRHEPTASIRR